MEEKELNPLTSQKKRRFKRICVFCGSKAGYKAIYGDAALELGKALVDREIDLVYGGGSVGLMGIISKTVFQGGRHVLGVIPRPLLPHEVGYILFSNSWCTSFNKVLLLIFSPDSGRDIWRSEDSCRYASEEVRNGKEC